MTKWELVQECKAGLNTQKSITLDTAWLPS